ncbi:MAG: hypothetical protein NT085_05435 [candidate division SR1 bacterium]|nr:hypothetical protein [candidate division SR1 bacterium]
MNIQKDNNNLLTIFNEKIPQTKEYTYHVSGYTFSDFDKGIIVLHKKEWKIISLKNLGDNMSVVYMKNTSSKKIILDEISMKQAFGLFDSFDEISGQTYFFIPNMSEKEMGEKNQILEKLHIKYRLKKTDKGIITDGIAFTETEKRISLLFGLLLLYGKIDAKKNELSSIKIQIPLFGQYGKHIDILDNSMIKLQEHGFFMKINKLPNKNGIVYQISSNDYELLEIFAQWYEAVEKFEKITKREFTQEMKTKLIECIETNPEIPQDGKAEVLKQLQEGTIKLLTK